MMREPINNNFVRIKLLLLDDNTIVKVCQTLMRSYFSVLFIFFIIFMNLSVLILSIRDSPKRNKKYCGIIKKMRIVLCFLAND